MSNHTAQDLLAAVGVDWKAKYERVVCPECTGDASMGHYGTCNARPEHETTYTGPALGTPDLDAVLWVEGQKWCQRCSIDKYDAMQYNVMQPRQTTDQLTFLMTTDQPGHALAAAIAEVKG